MSLPPVTEINGQQYPESWVNDNPSGELHFALEEELSRLQRQEESSGDTIDKAEISTLSMPEEHQQSSRFNRGKSRPDGASDQGRA